jgi:hypothetical protein
MATKNHVSLNGTASAAAQSTEINAKSISWISNNGAYDMLINFEETTTTSGAFKLQAGSVVNDIDIPVGTIYYSASGGDCSFSLFGIAR